MIQKYSASTLKELSYAFARQGRNGNAFRDAHGFNPHHDFAPGFNVSAIGRKKLPVLIINYDADTFGIEIVSGLKKAKLF